MKTMNIFILKIYFETIFLEIDFKIEQALDFAQRQAMYSQRII